MDASRVKCPTGAFQSGPTPSLRRTAAASGGLYVVSCTKKPMAGDSSGRNALVAIVAVMVVVKVGSSQHRTLDGTQRSAHYESQL